MTLRVLALVLLGVATSTSPARAGESFQELRSGGLALDVPLSLKEAPDVATWRAEVKKNRDLEGTRLVSPTAVELTVVVFGSNASELNHTFDEQFDMDSRPSNVQQVTYKLKKEAWYVTSGIGEEDRIFYQKVIRTTDDRRAEFVLSFPKSEEASVSPHIARMAKSFRFVDANVGAPAHPQPRPPATPPVAAMSRDAQLDDIVTRCSSNYRDFSALEARLTRDAARGVPLDPADKQRLKALGDRAISIGGEAQRLLRAALDKNEVAFIDLVRARINAQPCGFRIP